MLQIIKLILCSSKTCGFKNCYRSNCSKYNFKKVVFSAPNISSEIEEAGELYQAKFQNRTGQEWFGTIIKTKLVNGAANTTNQVWDANEEMKNPNRRNIWTALPVAGQQDINNFRQMMQLI